MAKEKIIGILGGMGPYATQDIFLKIIQATPAEKDWDHLHIIIDNNPKIPSRTKAILFGEESPLEGMIKSAKTLQAAGAGFVIIPCNSAHYWLDELRRNIDIPIIDMIDVTIEHINNSLLGAGLQYEYNKIGILGAWVTVKRRLYNGLKKYGFTVVYPNDNELENILQVIEEVKHGDIKYGSHEEGKMLIDNVISSMGRRGVTAFVLACTELGILNHHIWGQLYISRQSLFSPNEILAKEVVRIAKGMEF